MPYLLFNLLRSSSVYLSWGFNNRLFLISSDVWTSITSSFEYWLYLLSFLEIYLRWGMMISCIHSLQTINKSFCISLHIDLAFALSWSDSMLFMFMQIKLINYQQKQLEVDPSWFCFQKHLLVVILVHHFLCFIGTNTNTIIKLNVPYRYSYDLE